MVNVHRTFHSNFGSSFNALYQTSKVFLTLMSVLALKELPNIHGHRGKGIQKIPFLLGKFNIIKININPSRCGVYDQLCLQN